MKHANQSYKKIEEIKFWLLYKNQNSQYIKAVRLYIKKWNCDQMHDFLLKQINQSTDRRQYKKHVSIKLIDWLILQTNNCFFTTPHKHTEFQERNNNNNDQLIEWLTTALKNRNKSRPEHDSSIDNK